MDRYCQELWNALNPVQHPSSMAEKFLLVALIGCLGIFWLENTHHALSHMPNHSAIPSPKVAKPANIPPELLSAKG